MAPKFGHDNKKNPKKITPSDDALGVSSLRNLNRSEGINDQTRDSVVFTTFMSGGHGGKGDGLRTIESVLREYEIRRETLDLSAPRIFIPRCFELSTGFFDSLGLSENATPEEINRTPVHTEAREFLSKALEELNGPISVRSSASGEGACGIYKTVFLPNTKSHEERLEKLERAVMEVIASRFTPEAMAWQRKHNTGKSMAVLIMEIPCIRDGDYFYPFVSGVAKTRAHDPVVTDFWLAGGFGTKVVNSTSDKFPLLRTNFTLLIDIGNRHFACGDALNLKTGNLERINLDSPIADEYFEHITLRIAHYLSRFGRGIQEIERILGTGSYTEFCIIPGKGHYDFSVALLQFEPVAVKLLEPLAPVENSVNIVEGTDIVGHGVRRCNGIILFKSGLPATRNILLQLDRLNALYENYLLIINPQVISTLSKGISSIALGLAGNTNYALTYDKFNNAGAVVESVPSEVVKTDAGIGSFRLLLGLPQEFGFSIRHEEGVAGQHFRSICEKDDILFIAGRVDEKILLEVSGGKVRDLGGVLHINAEVEIRVDGVNGNGTVRIISVNDFDKYDAGTINEIQNQLFNAANTMEELELETNLFSNIYNGFADAIDDGVSPLEAKLDSEEVERVLEYRDYYGYSETSEAGSHLKNEAYVYLQDWLEHNKK